MKCRTARVVIKLRPVPLVLIFHIIDQQLFAMRERCMTESRLM